MKTPVIVSIGKAAQDVFLQSSKAFEPHESKGVLYEQLPLGQKLDLDNVIFATGGNSTNAAVTFARQGLHSRYIWFIGNDVASEAILQDLDREGVDTSAVLQKESFRASYSVILLASTGERTILNYHGSALGEHDQLDFSSLADADWVYLSSLGDIQLLEQIVSECKRHDVKIMLNPAAAELKHHEKLHTILEDIEVLIANKEEAQQIVEGNSLEELVRHGLHYCPVVIVSDGPNGALASDGQTLVQAGMYEDVPVIDRTGGGDAFGSGFLSYFSQGRSLRESMIFASANSTSVVTQIGAKAGILHKGTTLHDMPIEEKEL